MIRILLMILFLLSVLQLYGQEPEAPTSQDSTDISKNENRKESPFKTGFYTIGFFDVDLTYPIKLNNFESFRFGFGGITNETLFEKFKVGGYIAYGTKDAAFKYGIGGNVQIDKKTKSWLSLYYIDDITEVGTFSYLTDARVYSLFEPRLVNITQFYKHYTWRISYLSEFSSKILSDFRLANSQINQLGGYRFLDGNNNPIADYTLTELTASVRWSPNSTTIKQDNNSVVSTDLFPNISAQVTQGFNNILDSDFKYTKIGFKLDQTIVKKNRSFSNFILEANYATQNIPLTHLFHAFPNGPNKDAILQRFSVAGIQSFETMFFGEFYSDKLITFHAKHGLKPFKISERYQPQLVFISRYALGDLNSIDRHQGLEFNTLNHLYLESGFEINKLIFPFGFSFAYRYGAYHLPDFEDNISFKFTFNLKV